MSGRVVSVAILVGLAGALPVTAQQFPMTPAKGVVLDLPGGGLAVLAGDSGNVTVEGIVEGDSPAPAGPDIRRGDRVLRFQQLVAPGLPAIGAAWEALAVGAEVVLRLGRSGAELTVRYARPAAAPGRRMAVAGAGGAGAGAWVAEGGPGAVTEMVIAGAHIRSNAQGMPEVVFRGSDPAAALVPLRVGDVITAVDGRSISALAGLELLYRRIEPGAEVELTVARSGGQVTVRFARPDR